MGRKDNKVPTEKQEASHKLNFLHQVGEKSNYQYLEVHCKSLLSDQLFMQGLFLTEPLL